MKREWMMGKEGEQMQDIQQVISSFCGENGVELSLSSHMPEGYETAFGTYDVTVNTLYINLNLLGRAPQWEALYYVYHEMRHAVQYLRPERFDEIIQESRFYVVWRFTMQVQHLK